MTQEHEKRTAEITLIAQIDWPTIDTSVPSVSTTTAYYSMGRELTLVAIGYEQYYDPRILTTGNIERGATMPGDGIPQSRFRLSLDNSDLALSALFGSPADSTYCRPDGAEVRIYLAGTLEGAFNDLYRVYTGNVEGWAFNGGQLNLELVNVLHLLPDLTRTFPWDPADLEDFYRPAISGTQIPWVFGEIDTLANGRESMRDIGAKMSLFSTPNIDAVYACILRGAKFDDLYRDFPSQSPQTARMTTYGPPDNDTTNGWAQATDFGVFSDTRYSTSGHPIDWSGMTGDFLAANNPADAQDRYSYATVADATDTWVDTTTVTDYVYDLLRGIIEDLCGIDYDDVIDTNGTKWSAFKTACSTDGLTAGGAVFAPCSPLQLIQQICDEFCLAVTVTRYNKIQFYVDDSQYSGQSSVMDLVDIENVLRGSLSYHNEQQTLSNSVRSQYEKHFIEGVYKQDDTDTDADSELLYGTKEQLLLQEFVRDTTVSKNIAERILKRRAHGERLVELETSLVAVDLEVFDLVRLIHFELPDDAQTEESGERLMAVQRWSLNPSTMRITLTLREINP